MKEISLPVPVILFASFASGQNTFNLKKDHDAIIVKDLSVAAKFYGEILGLREIDNGGLGDHIRWFELNHRVQIHLIEEKDQIQKNKGAHMALNTDDLTGFMEFLKTKEVPFENWLGKKGTTNTRPDGIKQIYLQDPDGYWIEVNNNRL